MNTDVAVPAAPAVSRLGQATAVEQSRAVAEVQAAVVVAQQQPRNVQAAIDAMHQATDHKALAERAFFRFPRAGGQVTGPSIHLARELARVWGNVQYGINELRRDDIGGQSEMVAWAWDVQANLRSSTTFIVPHERDTKQGRKPLAELRDVYENNANNGARRVREMIFAVLPSWFVDEAKDRCAATIREGGGVPLPQRIASTIRTYAGIGVDEAQLVAKTGKPVDAWTEFDVANLTVIGQSLRRGETTAEEEFPRQTERLTKDALTAGVRTADGTSERTGQAPDSASAQVSEPSGQDTPSPSPAEKTEPTTTQQASADSASAGEARTDDTDKPAMANRSMLTKIVLLAKELGIYAEAGAEGRDEYLAQLSALALVDVTSATELTRTQAKWVIDRWTQLVAAMPKAPPVAPAEDTSTREQRLEVYHLIVDQAIAAGSDEKTARAAIEKHFARPVADLTLDQLTGYSQRHTPETKG